MLARLKGKKDLVLFDLGAGNDCHDLHASFAKIKKLNKVFYIDTNP